MKNISNTVTYDELKKRCGLVEDADFYNGEPIEIPLSALMINEAMEASEEARKREYGRDCHCFLCQLSRM